MKLFFAIILLLNLVHFAYSSNCSSITDCFTCSRSGCNYCLNTVGSSFCTSASTPANSNPPCTGVSYDGEDSHFAASPDECYGFCSSAEYCGECTIAGSKGKACGWCFQSGSVGCYLQNFTNTANSEAPSFCSPLYWTTSSSCPTPCPLENNNCEACLQSNCVYCPMSGNTALGSCLATGQSHNSSCWNSNKVSSCPADTHSGVEVLQYSLVIVGLALLGIFF